jgi:hypothetical protein
MAEILVPSRGCVYIPTKSRAGKGFYALKPDLRGQADSPILIDGADITDQDTVFPVATLDDEKFVFVMGADFGNVAITGMALLGRADQGGRAFRQVVEYFTKNRASAEGKPITVSMPGQSTLKVILTSLTVAKPDPEYHIQYFQLRGVGVEPLKA